MTDDQASSTPLRVATWNLNHWRRPLLPIDTRPGAWATSLGRWGAQVALLGEAVPPFDTEAGRHELRRACEGEGQLGED